MGWIFLEQLADSAEQLCSRFPNSPELGHWLKTPPGPFVQGWCGSGSFAGNPEYWNWAQLELERGQSGPSPGCLSTWEREWLTDVAQSPPLGEKKSLILSLGLQASTFPSSQPPHRQQGLGAARGASLDGELLSCLGNGGFLCKQFSGFFNAFTLKFNVLIPVCQQLLLCQEKLVHFEGVGCSFAGDTMRCLWVTEL